MGRGGVRGAEGRRESRGPMGFVEEIGARCAAGEVSIAGCLSCCGMT